MKTEKDNPKFCPRNSRNRMNTNISEQFISDEDHLNLICDVEEQYIKYANLIDLQWRLGYETSSDLWRVYWLAKVMNHLEDKPITRDLAERIMYECHLDSVGSLRPKSPKDGELSDHQRELLEKLDVVCQKDRSTEFGDGALAVNFIPEEFNAMFEKLRFRAMEAGLSRDRIRASDYLRLPIFKNKFGELCRGRRWILYVSNHQLQALQANVWQNWWRAKL